MRPLITCIALAAMVSLMAACTPDSVGLEDTPDIAVMPMTGLTTTEAGGSASFTIVLTSEPTATVTIGLSSDDPTEGVVTSAPTLTFTPSGAGIWSTPQTVTVTGQNDFVVDGPIGYTILTGAATSEDPKFENSPVADVTVTNTDDDVVGITVTPSSGLTTTEAGGTATFEVVLTSEPASAVVLIVTSSDPSEVAVFPPSHTFTPVDRSHTFTVTGQDDLLVDGDQLTTITLTVDDPNSDDAYDSIPDLTVSVTNVDDDTPGGGGSDGAPRPPSAPR